MNVTGRKIRLGAWITGLLIPGMLFCSCNVPRHAGKGQVMAPLSAAPIPARMDSEARGRYADSLFIEAENRKLQGDAAEAVRLFDDFLKLRPDNATAYYELALLNGREKNAPATLNYARKAVSLDSTNHWFAIAYGNALAMNKHFDSAAGVFHQLSLRYPSKEQYRYNEAVMLSSAGKYSRALELFDHLEKTSGVNEEFVYQKQRIFLEMQKPDSAALEIQKLIDINPGNSRFYGLLAQVYADNNQPDRAIRVYRSLLDKYPGNPQAMVALGLFYKQKGNDSAFTRYMTNAFGNPRFDIDEKLAFVYPYLKYVEIDSTKKDEALTLCRLIVKAHPDDPRAHTLYGDMYFQCRMPDSALDQYRETLALSDSSYEVWNQVMLLYATGGRNDSLLAVSGRAVALFPARPGGWYFQGMALFFAGRFQDCTRSLREALRHKVRDKHLKGRIYATLGEAYNNLRDYAASDSSFQTALRLNPADDLTLNNYSYYLAERGQYLDQALRMIKAAVALKPGSMTYEDTYGWVLFRLGKYKSAKTWMEKALNHPGARNHPGYLEHYGDILYRNHEVDQAVTYWKMAKEKGGASASLDRKIAKQKLPRRDGAVRRRRP